MLKESEVHTRDATRDHAVAVAELYEAHFERVWRWLHAAGVRAADLEDAAQEVFVIAHRRYGDFDGHAKVTTWLFAISVRVAAGFRRKAHLRRESVTDDIESEVTSQERAPGPDVHAMRREAETAAWRILDGLDDEKRAVFVMYELEEMTLKEIAAQLECPLQTVYSRLTAAREHFRREAERLRRGSEARP